MTLKPFLLVSDICSMIMVVAILCDVAYKIGFEMGKNAKVLSVLLCVIFSISFIKRFIVLYIFTVL